MTTADTTLALEDAIMAQAQIFAAAWSAVAWPFDGGEELKKADVEKEALRAMVHAALAGLGDPAALRSFLNRDATIVGSTIELHFNTHHEAICALRDARLALGGAP